MSCYLCSEARDKEFDPVYLFDTRAQSANALACKLSGRVIASEAAIRVLAALTHVCIYLESWYLPASARDSALVKPAWPSRYKVLVMKSQHYPYKTPAPDQNSTQLHLALSLLCRLLRIQHRALHPIISHSQHAEQCQCDQLGSVRRQGARENRRP